MNLRYFALQEWVESDLIVLKHIDTNVNESDILEKAVGQTFTQIQTIQNHPEEKGLLQAEN